MKKPLLLTSVLSAITVLLVAQSPPPPPTPTIQAQDQQSLTARKQSDSATAPPPTVSPAKEDASAKPQDDKVSSEPSRNGINFLAIVVAIATVLQFVAAWFQARYMRDGLRLTKEAANAAKKGAEAAGNAVAQAEQATAITQRAVVLIESIEAKPQIGLAHPYFAPNTVIVFTLKNYGATVAHKLTVKGEVMPGELTLAGAQEVTIAPQGLNQWITISLANRIPHDEIDKINIGNASLTYEVYVTYTDVFGKTHEYKTAGQYIAVLRGFITGSSTSD